jgi:copper chaperone CopZ
MKHVTVSVKGMNCNHCKMTVENGLKQFPEFKMINANLENESVTISGDEIDLDKIKSTVESLGYKFGGKIN